MRLAIFSDMFYPEHSGISSSIATIVPELARRGHIIQCFAPHYGLKDYRRVNRTVKEPDWGKNVSFKRLPSFPIGSASGQGRALVPTGLAYFALRRFRPDVIHVHSPYGAGLEALWAAKLLHVPLVGTEHTPIREFILRYGPIRQNWFAEKAERYDAWFYNHCSFVSSPCQAIFDAWPGFRQTLPHHPISNPVDTILFHPASRPAKNNKFVILHAGRFAKEKNIDHILQAIAALENKIPNLYLHLVGQGPLEQDLRALARKLGIVQKVKFLGYQKEKELPLAYRKADIFVITSEAETQSLVTMQAMLTGLPVVAAAAWGLKEYVRPQAGFLVPPGDLDQLTKTIFRLYKNPDLRQKLGKGGRRFAEKFSTFNIASEWERIYQSVLTHYNRDK